MSLDKSNQNRMKSWGIRLLHPKIAIPILLILAILIAPFAYRIHHLTSIPDPGDPFDVEAFIESSQVADTDNAYFDFQNAVLLMPSKLPGYSWDDWDKLHEELLTGGGLSAESQDLLTYVKRNKPAILAWKKGTTKADYSQGDLKEANMLTVMPNVGYSREFMRLSNTLAILAWQDGDYEKSADWYLVSFQTSRLIQQHGAVTSRLVSQALYAASASNLIRQIHDMNIPQNVLEKLLKEITSINKATPLLSDCLKVDYLTLMNSKGILQDYKNISYDLSPSQISWYFYLHAEPDLYLRLNKQWFGNVLPEVDRPRVDRSVFVGNPESPLLFNSTVKKQKNRKQMSPAEIDRAWNRPSCVMHFRSLRSINAEDRYRFYQRMLVTALKLEIYRRQHGEYPSSLKDIFENEAVPVDPFDPRGEAIKYARDSNASCRIWSNGPDTINNGGATIGFTNFETDYGYYLGKKIKQN